MDKDEIMEGIRRMEELHRVAGYVEPKNCCFEPNYEPEANPIHHEEASLVDLM